MHDTDPPPPQPPTPAGRFTRWHGIYRRTVVIYLLRGASYGLGTTAVSLITLWIQRQM